MKFVELPGLTRVSRLGLGTWQFGSREWGYGDSYAESEAGRILDRALDLAVTLIDTAEAYGFGRSERIVGQALEGRRDNDRLIIAWSPLAQGFLSARYDADHRPAGTVRRANSLFLPDNLRLAKPLFGVLGEVAAAHDATPAQVALAWLLHQPNVLVIPGASTVEQLERNVEAADLELTTEEVGALRAAAEDFHPVGGLTAIPPMITNWRAG